jgi:hypothetical protein
MFKQLACGLALYAIGVMASFQELPLKVLHEGNSTGEVKVIDGGKFDKIKSFAQVVGDINKD